MTQNTLGAFQDPIDTEEVQDYLDYVTTPLCLDEIDTKLKEHFYEGPEACWKDLKMIARNCMDYNIEGSSMSKLGKKFGNFIDDLKTEKVKVGPISMNNLHVDDEHAGEDAVAQVEDKNKLTAKFEALRAEHGLDNKDTLNGDKESGSRPQARTAVHSVSPMVAPEEATTRPVSLGRSGQAPLAMVSQTIDPLHLSEGALKAVETERDNWVSRGVADIDEPWEKEDAKRAHPDALFVKSVLHVVEKNIELSAEERKFRARACAQGCHIEDADGRRVHGTADDLYGSPVELATIRLMIATTAARPMGNGATPRRVTLWAADVKAAYLLGQRRSTT